VAIGEETERAHEQNLTPFPGFTARGPLAVLSYSITSCLRNTKQNSHLSNIHLKIVPLGNFALFPAPVMVLKTFLEVIL
jgi:hypothetical protein